MRQQIRITAALTAFVAALGLASVSAQDWDKKTIEKMLNDGTKKLSSADPKEREDGAGYILGYIRCSDRQKFVPILTKALKDPGEGLRVTVVRRSRSSGGEAPRSAALLWILKPTSPARLHAACGLRPPGVPSLL